MVLKIDGWQFRVDLDATMEHYARYGKDHCTCAYCRNFYASVDKAYPQLRPFLTQFGVDVECPAELDPFEPTLCDCAYLVKGCMELDGGFPITVGDAWVLPQSVEDADLLELIPQGQQLENWFCLTAMELSLPWVLEEDPNEVISTANDPEFLQRMSDKLLKRIDTEGVPS